MASKPITIRWIRPDSQPDWKIMYSIDLQTIFYKYQNNNHKIDTSFVSPVLRSCGVNKSGINSMILIFIFIENCLWFDAIHDFSVWLWTGFNPEDSNRLPSHLDLDLTLLSKHSFLKIFVILFLSYASMMQFLFTTKKRTWSI